MGETTGIEFTDRGYRQLVMALREAPGIVPAPAATPVDPDLDVLVSDGEVAYLDTQSLIRWVKVDRATEVPETWRPLLVGRSRREESGR